MKNIIILIIGAVLVSIFVNNKDYIMIPSTSIRLRVIAASDNEKDQKDKIVVKSALEETIGNLKLSNEYSSVDYYMESNKEIIDQNIKKIVNKNTQNISFTSNYGYNYFPEKEWKGVVYPSGYYKSYVVTIGNGEGENWWCVMYPPICLLDNEMEDYQYRSLIKDILNKYN